MRAVICSRLDGPAALSVGEMPAPALGPGQVRIQVKAAGLNFADTLIVQGRYQVKPELPFVPGLEAAGTIIEVAPDVTSVRPGARVMAALGIGAFAEQAISKATTVFPIPDSMDFVTAAGFPIVYGTAQGGLVRRGNLKAGETLLVLGAAGGVGVAAIEVGKAIGAKVIAAARGADKLEVARRHGADHVIDYAQEDLRERVKALAGSRGVDVVFDPVGSDAFDAALRTLGWEGRIVVVGFAGGRIPQIPANLLLVKNISAVGLFWGEYRHRDPALVHGWFAELMQWYEAGRIKPHVSHVFPAEQVGEAMDMLLARKSTGKIVLTF
jgi:NADPH2:quinone reductase